MPKIPDFLYCNCHLPIQIAKGRARHFDKLLAHGGLLLNSSSGELDRRLGVYVQALVHCAGVGGSLQYFP